MARKNRNFNARMAGMTDREYLEYGDALSEGY